MTESDKRGFFELLKSVFPVFDKQVPSAPVLRIWWLALERYPMQSVQAAFNHHIATAKFAPKPAEIISIIISHDGRPDPEEAWGVVVRAFDEAATVVWSREMQDAFAIAQPVFLSGDKIGARMAFRERYTALVADARAAMRPVKWSASVGHDVDLRKEALELAAKKGLLSPSYIKPQTVALAAPTPEGEAVAGLLTGSTAPAPESIREKIDGIRAVIAQSKFESKKQILARENRMSDYEAQKKLIDILKKSEVEA